MPAKVYLDEDTELLDLHNKVGAVIGFGSQGHAHALNLKDSGIEIIAEISITSLVGRNRSPLR